jgi:hypothetical protein
VPGATPDEVLPVRFELDSARLRETPERDLAPEALDLLFRYPRHPEPSDSGPPVKKKPPVSGFLVIRQDVSGILIIHARPFRREKPSCRTPG